MNSCLIISSMDSCLQSHPCPDVGYISPNLHAGCSRGACKRLSTFPTLGSHSAAGRHITNGRGNGRDGSRLKCTSTEGHGSLNSLVLESLDQTELASQAQGGEDVGFPAGEVDEAHPSSKVSPSGSSHLVHAKDEDTNGNKDVGFPVPVDEVRCRVFGGEAQPVPRSYREDEAGSLGGATESSKEQVTSAGHSDSGQPRAVLEQLTATFNDLDSALGDINSSVKQLNFSPNESRLFCSPDEVSSMPEEINFSSHHPYDPHRPNFSPLLPEAYRPYPSFEGWFTRLLDPEKRLSVGLIMATNYATNESQVTLLYCPSSRWEGWESSEPGKQSAERSSDVYDRRGLRLPDGCEAQLPGNDSRTDPTQAPVKTIAVAAMTKEARFTQRQHAADDAGESSPIAGFEWEAPGLGKISAKPHETDIDVTVGGYHFTAHLTEEILWNEEQSEAGPEGWARKIPLFPTHWYVYSLGSKASYRLSSPAAGINEEGSGFAHQEKNWGETFPAGHVWLQAISPNNDAQLVLSGAYFLGPGGLKLPYVFAGGFRSPNLNLDLRTNDPGTVFKDFKVSPLDGYFQVTAVTPSHTVLIKSCAPPSTFSDPILAPIGKVDWKPACRESYSASAQVEVHQQSVWGVIGERRLVEKLSFSYAALEFGEDLLEQARKQRQDEEEW